MKTKGKIRILEYLQKNGSITTWEAIQLFGDTRLSDKIYRLKKEGYLIEYNWESTKNRYGEPVKFKKYIYKGEKENV